MFKKILFICLFFILIGSVASGATILFPYQGGTGTGTVPTLGQILVGQSNGKYTPTSTIDGSLTLTGNLNATNVSSTEVKTGYVDFDLNDGYPMQEGRLQWNAEDGTLEFGLLGGEY